MKFNSIPHYAFDYQLLDIFFSYCLLRFWTFRSWLKVSLLPFSV